MAPSSRFTPAAAARMRAAIEEAGGIEVFAVGKLDSQGLVAEIEVHCRGNTNSVPALLTRPRAGEVVIHNHPSGNLQASDADMALANRYGEDGVGVVIVDNAVRRALWVVEPLRRELQPVAAAEVEDFFRRRLPAILPGHEPREAQLEMALRVAEALSAGHVGIYEAGTGTGKSLAYLVPAVLWATRNDSRVAVATFTINLQSQLINSDIPILVRAGLKFRHALLKGRSNYICKRRLKEEAERDGAEEELKHVARWAETAPDGSRSEMGFFLEEENWDRISSDHDQTLRARCPHFQECFYYTARRQAAGAHVVVVNHHLLLADLLVKGESGGEGILPRFDRVILDEGHHLEDAATSLFRQQVTARGLKRAIAPLIPRRKRPGALERIAGLHAATDSPLPPDERRKAIALIDESQAGLVDLHERAGWWLENLGASLLSAEQRQVRVTPAFTDTPAWHFQVLPTVQAAGERLSAAARDLAKLEDILDQLPEDFVLKDPQPLLDLARARRRLGEQAGFLLSFPAEVPGQVRWIEESSGKSSAPAAALVAAPVEVGPTLRERVFDGLEAIAACSATMTVDRRFDHFAERVGLNLPGKKALTVSTGTFPSPFDYRRQALLGLPTDIPPPTDASFEVVAARFVADALRVSQGGAFVLCTSFSQLRGLHRRVQAALGDRFRLLRQGEMGKARLLERFRDDPDSVLFGTDSFWEGVSVQGDSLRLVIIPRLPFRVPTEPVQQARYERLAQQGIDPFKAYSLPQAVLRFRQGFGRLIRTASDYGAVLVLDRRVLQMWYGRIFLRSLPDLEHVVGPGESVLARLDDFYWQNRPRAEILDQPSVPPRPARRG